MSARLGQLAKFPINNKIEIQSLDSRRRYYERTGSLKALRPPSSTFSTRFLGHLLDFIRGGF